MVTSAPTRVSAGRPGRLVRARSVGSGYAISLTCYFYKPQPLRSLEVRADILALEKDTEGMLAEIIAGGTS